MNHYDIGNEVILTTRFLNRFGASANPTTVTGAVKQPDGTLVVLVWTVTTTVGTWEATFLPTQEGKHWYSVLSSGVVNSAQEEAFMVDEKKVV